MLKAKDKGFELQSIHNCRNYNWCKDKDKHCAIYFSASKDKPKNAFIQYYSCSLDNGELCEHYNCGVQLCGN